MVGEHSPLALEDAQANYILAPDPGTTNCSTSASRPSRGGAKQVRLPGHRSHGLARFEISQWEAGEDVARE